MRIVFALNSHQVEAVPHVLRAEDQRRHDVADDSGDGDGREDDALAPVAKHLRGLPVLISYKVSNSLVITFDQVMGV